ncbi:MAG TPA: hypothetical protein VFT61_08155 [Sphingomicrobium sp.]|nr:hypothetical protein [Sphingomicrobium sp.]
MAKKMPLDRLRQISRTRKPHPLVRPQPDRQTNEPAGIVAPEIEDTREE